MRAKDTMTEWYFDIINPVLAEICRKNKLNVYVTGNMVQSKGNMPDSRGSGWVDEPRLVEARKGYGPNLPYGGSIASWFAEMGKCTKIVNETVAKTITELAPLIDRYTYFYEIEHTHIEPDSLESFIAIEKRLWNDCYQYGFTEEEFQNYRKLRRKEDIPTEWSFYICNDSEREPLCERLNEGVGRRNFSRISDCAFEIDLRSPFGGDILRDIMSTDTKKQCPIAINCTIPHIDISDELPSSVEGLSISITSIAGKSKTKITEFIKRNGGKITASHNPKTTVFIGKNISESDFIKESSDRVDYITYGLVKNTLLNGIARKALGESVCIALEDDFWSTYDKGSVEEVSASEELRVDEQGNLAMSMSQAESIWTVKAIKTGFSVSKYKGSEEVLYVPAYIDDKPVAKIDKGAKNATVKKIIIPSTVEKINFGAFPNYTQLEEVIILNENIEISAAAFSKSPLMFDKNKCIVVAGILQDCMQSKDLVISGTARVIPEYFAKNSNIKGLNTITFENGVEEIGEYAFDSCKDLKQVIISDTIKNILKLAFRSCKSIEGVVIGDGIETIQNMAFYDCLALKSVTLGKSLKLLDQYAFGNCKSLTDIYYNGTTQEWASIRKEYRWDYEMPCCTIHCTDGKIVKK